MSDISFAGLGAALGAMGMLVVATLALILECMLALRTRHQRWRTRLAGPALFALLAVVMLVLANSGSHELKQAVDLWFVPVVVLALLAWVISRSWPVRDPGHDAGRGHEIRRQG